MKKNRRKRLKIKKRRTKRKKNKRKRRKSVTANASKLLKMDLTWKKSAYKKQRKRLKLMIFP